MGDRASCVTNTSSPGWTRFSVGDVVDGAVVVVVDDDDDDDLHGLA